MNINLELYGNLIRSLEFSSSFDKMILRIFSRKIGKHSPNDKGDGCIYSILETNLYSDHDTEQLVYYKEYNCKTSAWAYISNRKPVLIDMGYKLTDTKSTSYYKKSFGYTNNKY